MDFIRWFLASPTDRVENVVSFQSNYNNLSAFEKIATVLDYHQHNCSYVSLICQFVDEELREWTKVGLLIIVAILIGVFWFCLLLYHILKRHQQIQNFANRFISHTVNSQQTVF